MKLKEQLGEVKTDVEENRKQMFEEEKEVVGTNMTNIADEQGDVINDRRYVNKKREKNQKTVQYEQETEQENENKENNIEDIYESDDENNNNKHNSNDAFPQNTQKQNLSQINEEHKSELQTPKNSQINISKKDNDSIYDEDVNVENSGMSGKHICKEEKKQILSKIQNQNNNQKRNQKKQIIAKSKPHNQGTDLSQIKATLTSLIKGNLLTQYNEFEEKINSKLYDLETKINDIYLKVSDYQAHPNLKPIDNNKIIDSLNVSQQTETSKYYHINNEKQKTKKLIPFHNQQYIDPIQEPQFTKLNRDELYNDIITSMKKELAGTSWNKIPPPTTDSKITALWKEAWYKVEHNNPNEGYSMILNSGDDIYWLRWICITGPVFNKLSPDIAKRVLMRINMISRSHQIQTLLISLIRNSITYNIFANWNQNEQNDILDSLFEFSGLNTKLGEEAAEWYTRLTK